VLSKQTCKLVYFGEMILQLRDEWMRNMGRSESNGWSVKQFDQA